MIRDYSQAVAGTVSEIERSDEGAKALAQPATKLDIIKLALATINTQTAALNTALATRKELEQFSEQFATGVMGLLDLIWDLAPDYKEELNKALAEFVHGKQ